MSAKVFDTSCCGGVHSHAVHVDEWSNVEYSGLSIRTGRVELRLTDAAARKVHRELGRMLDLLDALPDEDSCDEDDLSASRGSDV